MIPASAAKNQPSPESRSETLEEPSAISRSISMKLSEISERARALSIGLKRMNADIVSSTSRRSLDSLATSHTTLAELSQR